MKSGRLFKYLASALLALTAVWLLASCQSADLGGPKTTTYKDDKGTHVVYEEASGYTDYVAYWDGQTVTFSDGREITLKDDDVVVVEDKNGVFLDKYMLPKGFSEVTSGGGIFISGGTGGGGGIVGGIGGGSLSVETFEEDSSTAGDDGENVFVGESSGDVIVSEGGFNIGAFGGILSPPGVAYWSELPDAVTDMYEDENDDYLIHIVYESAESFYASRPHFNGGTITMFGGIVGYDVQFGKRYVAEDKDGNVLCRYGREAKDADNGGEVEKISVEGDITVVRIKKNSLQNLHPDAVNGRLCMIWNATNDYHYKSEYCKYEIKTPYVAIVNIDGDLIEHLSAPPEECRDEQPEFVKKVFKEGNKTVAVLSDEVYDIIECAAYRDLYDRNSFAENEQKPYSAEALLEIIKGKTLVAAHKRYGNRAVFFDGSSIEISGGRILFISEREYNSTDTVRDYWTSDIYLKNPTVRTKVEDYYVVDGHIASDSYDRIVKATGERRPFTCIIIDDDVQGGRAISKDDITVDGNKVILPCGTEITCKYDDVVFVYHTLGGGYGVDQLLHIDLDHYNNLAEWYQNLSQEEKDWLNTYGKGE